MAITKEDVEHVARLARIALTEKEKSDFTVQLSRILGYIDQLGKVPTQGVEPMAQPIPLKNVYREDAASPSGSENDIIALAPDKDGRFFKVRKVMV